VGVDALSENDEVVIFYSVNADTISFELLHKLMFCKAKLSYYKIRRGGRNALDFQLSTYLGFLVSSRADTEFYIISKDNGFDFVIDFWESGCLDVKPSVKRFHNVKAAIASVNAPARQAAQTAQQVAVQPVAAQPAPQPTVPQQVATQQVVPQIVEVRVELPLMEAEPIAEQSVEADVIEKMLSESESPHELYIKAVKKFGQKKGVEIYRDIKSRFAKVKKEDVNGA